MKQLIIYILFVFGFLLWIPFITLGALVGLIADLFQTLDPKIKVGNCWYHALPRWIKSGGYLAIRPADGQRFLKIFMVPHVIWIKSFDPRTAELEQYVPINRQKGSWLPWHTIIYEGRIRTTEINHPAKEIKE